MNPYDPLYDEDAAIARAYLDNLDAAPDQRLAALDAANAVDLGGKYAIPVDATQQPGPPPSMSDAPVSMGTPEDQLAAQRAVARDMAAQQSIPEPGPPPEGIAAQPVAYEGGAVQPQQPAPFAVGPAAREIYRGAMGSRGHVVPEHEQKLGYSVQRQAPIDRTRVEEAYAAQGELAEEHGRKARFNEEDNADAALRRKLTHAADLATFDMQQQEQQQALQQRETDYQKLVEESRVDPDVFWSRRDTGEKIMAAIGGLLMGLGGNADKFIQMIEGEREHAQEERDREVTAARDSLADFRERTYTPQAADAYEDALKARIVAEDLRMMAAEAQSVEAQMRGEEEAVKIEAYAAEKEAAARAAEAGAIAEKVAVVPRRVVGGSQGGLPGMLRKLGQMGASKEQQLKFATLVNEGQTVDQALGGIGMAGSLKPSDEMALNKDERTRRVRMEDGSFAWVADDRITEKIQSAINATAELQRNYARQRALLNRTVLSPADRAEYNGLAARNTLLQKESEVLGAVTKADQDMTAPITGEGGADITALKANTLRSLDGAEQHVGMRQRNARKLVYSDPDVTKPLVTDTEQGLGVEVD